MTGLLILVVGPRLLLLGKASSTRDYCLKELRA